VINGSFHLASIVDSKGQPIKDLASSYKKPLIGPNNSQSFPSGFYNGTAGPGVAGATVRIRFVTGNSVVGHTTVAEIASVVLDENGTASFKLTAGTHVEEAFLYVDVLTNPKNSWLTPTIRSQPLVFQPGGPWTDKPSDDGVPFAPYSLALKPPAEHRVLVGKLLVDGAAKQRKLKKAPFAPKNGPGIVVSSK
jgi:hypothetical protein